MKKSLLAASAAALVVTPVIAGLLWSPVAAAPACEPVPVMETHTLPPYPMDSIHAKETGIVMLQVGVARNGHVNAAKVAHSSGHVRLDEAAASYVRQHYLWQPMACGQAQTNVKVVFSLLKDSRDRIGSTSNDPQQEVINRTVTLPAKH